MISSVKSDQEMNEEEQEIWSDDAGIEHLNIDAGIEQRSKNILTWFYGHVSMFLYVCQLCLHFLLVCVELGFVYEEVVRLDAKQSPMDDRVQKKNQKTQSN